MLAIKNMKNLLHPSAVLYAGNKPFPLLAACEHFAGSEKLLNKALQIQAELAVDGRSVFDITADCEDGAPAGKEREHAEMIASTILADANRYGRVGARIHDVRHPAWRDELETVISCAGQRVAYVVLPKPENAADVATQIAALDELRSRHGIAREIPVHVLIETPGALHEAWEIARLPHIEVLDFGLMDFVSGHHGAIHASNMRSPGQFEHPLIVRAKGEIVAAALAHGVVPSHNVSLDLKNPYNVFRDAWKARQDFGFLRMWSIHPSQIQPIVDAMKPDLGEVADAAAILVAAQRAKWGPIQYQGELHDRATYRYFWQLLLKAKVTGVALPEEAADAFFAD